jgi:hypothetical protein
MYLLLKAYDVPQSVISGRTKGALRLSLTEDDLRRKGLNRVPDDLFDEPEASGVPDITAVTQFVRGPHPLSPAETGHYHYGRRRPGMNTDASGSYRREEVLPQPQRLVGEKVSATDWPIPPREVSSN